MEWPARLAKFSFSGVDHESIDRWRLSALGSILATHKLSLQHILIGSLGHPGLADFDLAEYDRLETLNLSYWATGCNAGYEANILAPNLQKFTWRFTGDDGWDDEDDGEEIREVTLLDFGQPQEDWLRRLAAAARMRNSPLHQIHIQYAPDDSFHDGLAVTTIYPWDRMDRIAGDILNGGIQLSYDPPSITREAFQNLIHSLE